MKNNISLDGIAQVFKKSGNILLITHVHPDGDTLGSAFALKHALPDKNVCVVCDDDIPERLAFITDNQAELALPESFVPDLVVSIDVADTFLMGKYKDIYSDKFDLKIDHHVTSLPYAKYNYVDGTAAACGEIIYKIVKKLGALNKSTALPLYAAIASDTGCFKYRNVTARTFRIAAELIRQGIDHSSINVELFESKSYKEIIATKTALNNLKYYLDGRIALINFTNEIKKAYGLNNEDLSGLNGLPREIKGVELGIIIKQNDDNPTKFKVSMRSGVTVDVSALCAKFGGGGHLRAAGADLSADSPQQAEDIIIKAALEYITNG